MGVEFKQGQGLGVLGFELWVAFEKAQRAAQVGFGENQLVGHDASKNSGAAFAGGGFGGARLLTGWRYEIGRQQGFETGHML